MDMELLIALGSGVISFFILLGLMAYFNRIFNIEIPDFIRFAIGFIIIIGLYIKRDFFFGYNPVITGTTIGFILAMLWDIKSSEFMLQILKVVISIRFLLWVAATAAGIFKRDAVLVIWDKYIASRIGEAAPYMLIVMLAVYVTGSAFIIFAESYVRNRIRSSGFSMINTLPKSRIIRIQIVGVIMVLISSPLIINAVLFIQAKLLSIWPAA